ncbi:MULTISPECIES: ATP-binding cassette domain-containing protein [unclassified Paenibacillus]|uniref:ATP-binding cassette domain-containing protein n=1 Tax=unclassified Paenibacillus TaxID=185978 RepID=UPI0020D193EC|nr:ATP-binding cassette domain-containing protein [Paenibacillus sp. 7541]
MRGEVDGTYSSRPEESYGKKQVLAGGDFRFEQGKIYGLLGRNGAGKTTLFNCLSRETQADSGSIKLMDRTSVRDLKEDDVGYVYSLPWPVMWRVW